MCFQPQSYSVYPLSLGVCEDVPEKPFKLRSERWVGITYLWAGGADYEQIPWYGWEHIIVGEWESCAYLLILQKLDKTLITNKSVKRDRLTFKLHWFVYVWMHAQLCLTLCDPMDYSLPGSSIHGFFQARILEWVVISYSRGYSWPRDQTCVSSLAGRFCFTVPPGKYSFVHSLTKLIKSVS